MNKEVAHILKERLAAGDGLPFVDVLAGIAQKVTYKEQDENGNSVTKMMPVSYDTNASGLCKVTPETAIIPDSTKKGILYFEDMGSNFVDRVSGGAMKYRSTLVLVCWMNRRLLVADGYQELTAFCITSILDKLKINRPFNVDMFTRFKVSPGRMLPQDAAVFSRYTYDEAVTQYLRPPFEYFGLELQTEFCIHPSCLNQINFITPPTC